VEMVMDLTSKRGRRGGFSSFPPPAQTAFWFILFPAPSSTSSSSFLCFGLWGSWDSGNLGACPHHRRCFWITTNPEAAFSIFSICLLIF